MSEKATTGLIAGGFVLAVSLIMMLVVFSAKDRPAQVARIKLAKQPMPTTIHRAKAETTKPPEPAPTPHVVEPKSRTSNEPDGVVTEIPVTASSIRQEGVDSALQASTPHELTEPDPIRPQSIVLPLPGSEKREIVPGFQTREINGFTVLLSVQAVRESAKLNHLPMQSLSLEMDGLLKVLPRNAHKPLRKVLIWIEWDRIDEEDPNVLGRYYGGNIHRLDPNEHILKSNAIELLSLKRLDREKRELPNNPRLVLLHEFGHAVHHLVVGYEDPAVKFAYKQAMDRRLYDNVDTASGEKIERAYAATNPYEYFAELTCAYLDRCNTYPFTRLDLKEHDPTGFRVMVAVWGSIPSEKPPIHGPAKPSKPKKQ